MYFKKSLFIFSLLSFLSFWGCNEDKTPEITPSTQALFTTTMENNGIAPAEVTFINKSINAINYRWDLGSGSTFETNSTDSFSHTYYTPGIYTVKLSVESPNPELYYNTLVFEKDIIIGSKPVQRLYFADRNSGTIKYIALDNEPKPVICEFEGAMLNKPYGMDMDTANGKLYVLDYGEKILHRFNWDGVGQEIILNSTSEHFNSPIGVIVINDKIYWSEPGGIHCSNLDGTNPQIFVSLPGEFPQDLAYDPINKYIYFSNDYEPESGGIWKVALDGSNLKQIIPLVWGAAIEVDAPENRLYFYSGFEGMYICDLDGNNLKLFDSTNAGKWVWGMAIDKIGKKIYYPNRVDMTIMRADLDGNNVETFIPSIADINPNAMTIDTYR